MKKIGATLSLLSVFMQSTAMAWVGGPYSNNTYDGLDGGIYQYTMRGHLFSGMARFNQNVDSAFNSQFGDSICYWRGRTFYGESYGFVDTYSKAVDGITNGSANGTDGNPQSIFTSATGTQFGVSNAGAGRLGGAGDANSYASIVNTSWKGKLTSTKPVQRFRGKGKATVMGDGNTNFAALTNTTTTVINNGVNPPTPAVVGPPAVPAAPAGNGNTTGTLISRPGNGPEVRSTLTIRVNGGRISTGVYAGPVSFQGI